MSKLRPGKGGFFDLTLETIDFFHEAIEDVWNAARPDEENQAGVNDIIDDDRSKEFLKWLEGSASGWKKESDTFGTKLYKTIDWQGGAYRVTVVVNKRGELKLDIRSWFDPEA